MYSRIQDYKGYKIGGYGVFLTSKSKHPAHRYAVLESDKTEIIEGIETLKEAKQMIDEMVADNV